MNAKQIAVLVMLGCAVCFGQGHFPSKNVPGSQYPRLNADLSATFRIEADQAQEGQVLMDLGQVTYYMVKGEDGSWEVTTKPLLLGFHYYLISADGFTSSDPGSKTSFAATKEVSAIEVPFLFAAKDVPHGIVRIAWYFEKTGGDWRRIFVACRL